MGFVADAAAEDREEGLGSVLFSYTVENGFTMRVDNVPKILEPYFPSKEVQQVRIAQLEMLAILLAIRSFGLLMSGSYCRIRVHIVSAISACLAVYSGTRFMARPGG